jgi:hypothetical protein
MSCTEAILKSPHIGIHRRVITLDAHTELQQREANPVVALIDSISASSTRMESKHGS